MFKRKPSVAPVSAHKSASAHPSASVYTKVLSLDDDPHDFIRSLMSSYEREASEEGRRDSGSADGKTSGIGRGSGQKKRTADAAEHVDERVLIRASAKKQRVARGAGSSAPSSGASRPKAPGSNVAIAVKPPSLPMYNSFFEFHEAGAFKIVLDTIQYELDGLFNTAQHSNSTSLRRHCASKLFEIISESIDNKHIIVASGVSKTLIRVVGLLSSESDFHIRVCLQAMLLYLCRDDRGAIDCASISNVPVNVFEGVVVATFEAMAGLGAKGDRISGESCVSDSAAKSSSSSAVRRRSFAVQRPVVLTGPPSSSPALTPSAAKPSPPPPAEVLAHSQVYLSLLLGSPPEGEAHSSEEVCLCLGTAFLNRFLFAAVNDTGSADSNADTAAQGAGAAPSSHDLARSREALLAQFQKALCTPKQQLLSTSGPETTLHAAPNGDKSLLHLLCTDLLEGVIRIKADTFNGKVPSTAAAKSLSTSSRLRMWHALGVLECSSSNCPESQEHLSSLVCQAGREAAPAPVVIFRLLQLLSEVVLREIVSAEETISGSPPSSSNGNDDYNCEEDEDLLSSLSTGRDAEKDQIRALYPELCSRESTQQAAGSSGKLFDSTGSCLTHSKQRLALPLKELWLSALRVLVNLTHRCPKACDALREAGFLPFAASLLAIFFEMKRRRSDSSSGGSTEAKSSASEGPLSPSETRLEKAVFDASLFVTSTVTNIYESCTAAVQTQTGDEGNGAAADECLGFARLKLSDTLDGGLFASIADLLRTDDNDPPSKPPNPPSKPPSPPSKLRGLEERVRQQTLQLQISAGERGDSSLSSSEEGVGSPPPPADFTAFLTAFLAVEAADFVGDIVSTDDAFLNGGDKGKGGETGKGRGGESPTTPPPPLSPPSTLTPPTTERKAGEQLPVAELILSSHIVLLLYAIARRGREIQPNGGSALVVDLLPRKNWWLPIRILKAFLALQGQAGVLVVASVAPVVAALTSMSEWGGGGQLQVHGGEGGFVDGGGADWLTGEAHLEAPAVNGESLAVAAAAPATGRWVREGDDYKWIDFDDKESSQGSGSELTSPLTLSSLSSGQGEPNPNPGACASHNRGAKVRTFSKRRSEAVALASIDDMVLY